MAIFGQFTKRAQQVLMTAQECATREGQPYVGTLHFLYGLLDVGEAPESVTRHIQKEDVKQVLDQIDDEVSLHPGHGPVQMTPRARRVLDGMTGRNARWYYLSSLANQGLGKSVDALQDARRAVQLDPNNTEYQMHLRRMQNPGQTYRTQTTYAQPGGLMRWCWSMILLNLLCNCCCGGWGFRGFRM